ncbi:hypothetical protein B5F13_13385 [Drancourtella sp. An177]|nr:hypothetical protein B5F13_13385 [Drancourtella sp. An177]
MGHKVPQSQYFHGLWHSFFFSTVKDGIIYRLYFDFNLNLADFMFFFPFTKMSAIMFGVLCRFSLSVVFSLDRGTKRSVANV